jgi:hypothetical protein
MFTHIYPETDIGLERGGQPRRSELEEQQAYSLVGAYTFSKVRIGDMIPNWMHTIVVILNLVSNPL